MTVAALVSVLTACANIGTPEGGPRDYAPPRAMNFSPANGATGVDRNRIEITFDEIVNIKDQQKKVTVSPVQREMPSISAQGKKITIELRDTLKPNTTYTIDFGSSIEDNNESNPMGAFSYAFSTGDEIDTLQISGLVLRARDLEPMQYVLVGVHTVLDDSAFTTLPLDRIVRTNDRGQFTLRNLRAGQYRLYALNDMDGDYKMARTEDIAFLDEIVVPSVGEYSSQDTTFTFDHRVDTIVAGTHTLFLPNDLLLCMFNENYRSHYLKKTERVSDNRLHVLLSAPCDSLPRLQLLTPPRGDVDDSWCRIEHTSNNDSIFYWLTDSALIKSDTIIAALTYLRTDSTDQLVPKTDTITFAQRNLQQIRKQAEKAQKEREKKLKQIEELRQHLAEDSIKGNEPNPDKIDELEELLDAVKPPEPTITVQHNIKNEMNLYDTICFTVDAPVQAINNAAFHLERQRDTLWIPIDTPLVVTQVSPSEMMRFMMPFHLEPDSSYRLKVDSAAMTSAYGAISKPLEAKFKVRGLEEYGNLYFNVNVAGGAFAELLDGSERLVKYATVEKGQFSFPNVMPGTYYVRLTLDSNGNGRWDTGNYKQKLQPEEVYYFPAAVKVRSNWDIDQTWNIYQTAVDLQKPDAIRHNKPDREKGALAKKNQLNKKGTTSDEDEDEDEFNSSSFGNTSTYSGNRYNDYRNNK